MGVNGSVVCIFCTEKYPLKPSNSNKLTRTHFLRLIIIIIIIMFLYIYKFSDWTARYVDQGGGKRKGSIASARVLI